MEKKAVKNLARKWRPAFFKEIVGQEQATTLLTNALKFSRVPQALLFAGPRGVGKTTTARILAKALNCEKRTEAEPCGECTSCKAMAEGRHLGVIEIDAASHRGVSEIEKILEDVSYIPMESIYKVYIIDEVHMLSNTAFNALLKTLEEPPERVVFVLATTEPEKIPLTVRSRCLRIDFKPVPENLILERLKEVAQKEGINLDQEAAFLIARGAAGSLRDALVMLEQVATYASGTVSREAVEEALSLEPVETVCSFLKAAAQKDLPRLLSLAADVSRSGKDPVSFARQIVQTLRDVLVYKINPQALSAAPKWWIDQIEQLKPYFSSENLLYLIEHAIQFERDIRNSPFPGLVLEAVGIKLANLMDYVPPKKLMEMLQRYTPQPAKARGPVKEIRTQPAREQIPPIVKQAIELFAGRLVGIKR